MHAELSRIDVNADENVGVLRCCLTDKRKVPFVKGSHGGHKADGSLLEEEIMAGCAEGRDVADHLNEMREGGGEGPYVAF